jgi:hypothetical protein
MAMERGMFGGNWKDVILGALVCVQVVWQGWVRSTGNTDHSQLLLCYCVHLQHPRLKLIISNQRRLEGNQYLPGRSALERAGQRHLLQALQKLEANPRC